MKKRKGKERRKKNARNELHFRVEELTGRQKSEASTKVSLSLLMMKGLTQEKSSRLLSPQMEMNVSQQMDMDMERERERKKDRKERKRGNWQEREREREERKRKKGRLSKARDMQLLLE